MTMHLGRILEKQAQERPKETALLYEDREISFLELDKSVNRVASGLKKLGIQRQDRVAIMLPNTPEFVYTFYACQKLGAVAVPFNTMYKGKEIAHILMDSGAKAIVCLTNFVSLINEIKTDLPKLEHIITTGERTLTFAEPDSTLFVQMVLSKKIFTGLDDAYRRIGDAVVEAVHGVGIKGAWYRHRGSVRVGGKKVAGFLISEVEDVYLINTILFTGKFKPSDFFAAVWVPPEVKDKMIEPLTSIEEETGNKPEYEKLRRGIVGSLQKQFGVAINEGAMTREERFGYEKQRGLAAKSVKQSAAPVEGSAFTRLKRALFKKK